MYAASSTHFYFHLPSAHNAWTAHAVSTTSSLDEPARRAIIKTSCGEVPMELSPTAPSPPLLLPKMFTGTGERVWKRFQASMAAGNAVGDATSHIKQKSGQKPIDRADLREKLRTVPGQQWTKIWTTASAIGVSTSVVQRLLADGNVKRQTTTIDPALSAENMLQRISYALSFIDDEQQQCGGQEGHPFSPMYHMAHVDEKWFHRGSSTRSYYLLPDEEPPKCSLRSALHPEGHVSLCSCPPRYPSH